MSYKEMKDGGQQKLQPLLVVPSLPPMNLNYNMQQDNSSDDSHMDVCFTCGGDGELVCCDGAGCNKAYHAKCAKLDINALPPIWNCPSCRLGVGHQSASTDESVPQYVPAANGGLATTTSFNIGCIIILQTATSCYNGGQVGVIKSISTDTSYTIELQSNKKLVRAKLTNMKRYTPRGNDVILGRGVNSPGNIKYRDIITQNKPRYQAAEKGDKKSISEGIVQQIRDGGGYFLEEGNDNNWYDIGDKKACGKVSQALREKSKKKSTSTVVAEATTAASLVILPRHIRKKKASGHPLCKIKGCDKEVQKDEMCTSHYNTFKLAGRNTKETGEESTDMDMLAEAGTNNVKKVARSSSMVDEDQPPKKKQNMDPNAPKKANNAFMIYSNENRDIVKAENPGIVFGDIAKFLSARYHAIGSDERARLDKLVAKDKERYDREMREYVMKQSLPQQERVKTAEDSMEIIQSTPLLSNTQYSPPATLQNVGMAQQPTPTTNTPSVTTNKHQQPVGTKREVVTPHTLPKNYHNISRGVPSNNKENSISSTETLVNMDRVHAMEESSRRERKVMVASHLKQMMDKTATIVLERVDGLIGCHTKDKDELYQCLEKKFGDKKKSIVNEIAKLNTMLANANERGHRTTDINADLNRETTKLKSVNAVFESEKNEWLDRLKNKYVSLYEATKEEFIDLGTNQLPLSVIDICSAKWNTYLDSM